MERERLLALCWCDEKQDLYSLPCAPQMWVCVALVHGLPGSSPKLIHASRFKVQTPDSSPVLCGLGELWCRACLLQAQED
eukprot:scaffold206814_cov23-Tisochrysis_lutea.AAC.1